MKKKFKKKIALLFFAVAIFLQTTEIRAAYAIPPKPSDSSQTFVYDYVKLFSIQEYNDMAIKLKQYADSTSTQIVVVTIPSTDGENINYLGAQWISKWGIGQKNKDNGVLILLARNDRRVAINSGYGVEHLLTDAICRRVIELDMIPQFKQNNYYRGINNSIDSIFKILQGEFVADPKKDEGMPVGLIIFLMLFFFVLMVILMNISTRGGGSGFGGGRGGHRGDSIIFTNTGRHSGSFGGGSSWGGLGGGFGGGGGGGGGASGGW